MEKVKAASSDRAGDVVMMVSDWARMWQSLLSHNLGVLAVMIFLAVAVAVVAYRIASNIDGPLMLSGALVGSFMLTAVGLEKGADEGIWLGVFFMSFVGIGKAAYERLLGPR